MSIHKHGRLSLPIILATLAVIVVECIGFNIAFWRTFDVPTLYTSPAIIGSGLHKDGNDGHYTITNPQKATITVPIHTHNNDPAYIQSLRVIPGVPVGENSAQQERHAQTVQFSLKPANSAKQVDLEQTLRYTQSPATQYLVTQYKARDINAQAIQLHFQADAGTTVSFHTIVANAKVPFSINPARLIIEILIAAFFVLLRPSSRLYCARINRKSIPQNVALALFIVGWSILLALIAQVNRSYPTGYDDYTKHFCDPNQYQQLADAILHGRTTLDLPVDPALTTMQNPYDFEARKALVTYPQEHTFYWDHAYYNGKYYCYFGIVPAIFTFIPFKLITGQDLPNYAAAIVFTTLATIFGTLLIRTIAHKYFPRTSLGMMWLAIIGANISNCLFIYCRRVQFYDIPMTAALAFVTAGLYWWISSQRNDGSICVWRIALGSACMALEFGTRPQYLIACFLAFPIFWQAIRHNRTLFSHSSIAATIGALAPFVLIVAPLMWYNFIRFGSPINFGQNYNLTGYDLNSWHIPVLLIPLAYYMQFFQPEYVTGAFPFLTVTDTSTFIGPHEPSLGGLFAVAPFLLFSLFLWLCKQPLQQARCWGIVWSSFLFACIASFVDIWKSGITMRYYGDYAYLLIICAVFVIFACESAVVDNQLARRALTTLVVISVVITICVMCFGLFANGLYEDWGSANPTLYETVHSWFPA